MRAWIAGVAAASLLSGMAVALTPAGRVRQVTKLVCALLCALAVAGPLVELDFRSLSAGIALYEQQASRITGQAQEEAKMLDRTYIEERCQAYILAKAAEEGIALEGVTVTARWDEEDMVWYPWTAALDGARDPRLARVLEGELGIPAARQSWRDDG